MVGQLKKNDRRLRCYMIKWLIGKFISELFPCEHDMGLI